MKRTVEISASFTGVIPTGSYENERPFYAVKEILATEDGEVNLVDEEIIQRQEELHKMCYERFKKQAEVSYQERIAKTYKDLRFYDYNGKKLPSVTSIINLDKDFGIPPDSLQQYASRGTLIHKQVEIFLTTEEWKAPKDIEECSFDYLTVVKGDLGLDFENVDFKAFYESYPFKVIELEKTTYNEEYLYAGRMDIIAVIEKDNPGKWAKIEGVVYDEPIIFDVKTSTTLDKMSGLTQGSAYARAENIKHTGLIHLTKENQCGFAKPILTNNIERYFNLFLNKRKLFKDRFGI